MEISENKPNKYVSRLVKEWRMHGKIIIAVDYDSTISYWPTIENQDDIEKTIKLLQVAHETGAYIVINTACKEDRFEDIQKHCEEVRLPINGINTPPISTMYGNANKLYANIFLDDRAGLNEALEMLEEAMYIIRGEKSSDRTAGEYVTN